ncbi:MAG: RluA family pseudouridine synthase, partial [Mucinivorans sp.]
PMLRIVFEDEWILVVEKRNGLLSIATDKQPTRTAYNILSDYLKREDPSARIFIVHRLDRETSGLMIFAKDQELKFDMQRNWEQTVLERKYYAVVEGIIEKKEGVISTYLTESKALKVYATRRSEGKVANTAFKVLATTKNNTLLELQLETGRKNQIRAHMEFVGHPIIGDKKYGASSNPLGRVALHAGSLNFIHPATGEQMSFSTPIPISFTKMFTAK